MLNPQFGYLGIHQYTLHEYVDHQVVLFWHNVKWLMFCKNDLKLTEAKIYQNLQNYILYYSEFTDLLNHNHHSAISIFHNVQINHKSDHDYN